MSWNMKDTHTLAKLMRHTEEPSNFWLNRYFGSTITFDTEFIDFERIVSGRRLAPFVSPMAKGVIQADRGSEMIRFKPGYVKPKHALDPTKVIKRRAGEMIGGSSSPGARHDAILMEYLQDHHDTIARRLEWMAAKAIMNGQVVVEGDNYPSQTVDFNRDAGNTVVKTLGNYWGESGVSIKDDLNSWINTIRRAKFSGPVTDLIVPPEVYAVMVEDTEMKDLMDNNYRGSKDEMNRSILDGSLVQYVGKFGGFLNIFVYQDWYEDDAGNVVEFMANNEIVLAGANVQGVRTFGAIMDAKAGYQPMDIFSKMYEEEDPSATFLLSQSAPLMVPVNTNNTFKAKVLA